jgi:UDP-N-acetylglucosamine:LPS N-acetylglucosamine transferase
MERKPIILILTSKDEPEGLSALLKDAIQKIGNRNVVVLSDDKYGTAKKTSRLERFKLFRRERRFLIEKKADTVFEKLGPKSLSKRVNRIHNAVKRFRPEFVLAITPYAHGCAAEAKRRAKFSARLIYFMQSFTAEGRVFDEATDVFLVENSDMKSALVRNGVRSKDIMTLGLPYMAQKPSAQDAAALKQEYGLPRSKTVFVNVRGKKKLEETLSLLLDQGDIINLVVYAEDADDVAALRAKAAAAQGTTVVFVTKRELYDDYLKISDIVVTRFDVPTIYKCMQLGVPAVTLAEGETESVKAEISYLVENGLVLRAKENIEVVALLYKLMQTDAGAAVRQAGEKWTENASLDNLAEFFSSYIPL